MLITIINNFDISFDRITKTISFTAHSSFSFTPYLPSTNIQKPYTVSVVVQ